MCKKLRYVLCLALVLGLAGAVAAQDWDIEIPSTRTPPTIDGQVDGVWSISSVQYITVAIEGSVDSPADASGSWRALWDADNLYVIVDVNDEDLFNDSANSYQDDSVEVYFDGGNSKGPGAPLSEDNRQYTFGWTTDDIAGTNQNIEGVEHAQVNTVTGWRIEIKLPWSSLQSAAPVLGDLIGIDCFYNDDDNGADTRESQIATFAGSSADWQIPANWGTGILVRGSREKASGPSPEDGATDVLRDAALAWMSGEFAQTHDVYFGTVFEDVNSASRTDPLGVLVGQGQTTNSYDRAGLLEYGQTYYWRIDEVNGAPDNTIFKGEMWSFTTELFADPIEGVIATSNTVPEAGGTPEKTVDGSGLNEAGEHSINAGDMWLGVPVGDDPVWIQYEFDRVYKLHEMLVWNYNSQFELVLGFGFKDVTVEYSENGTDWMVLGDEVFAQASARAAYTANTTVAFNGVGAKYVRLTANSGHGPMGQFGLSEVRILAIPVQARQPDPADGAGDVDPAVILNWRAGREAVSHEIYLSADEAAVTDGTALIDTVGRNSYTPAGLEFGSTYFWKINEVNEAEAVSVWEGDVWSFGTQEYAVIDDFESYNDEDNLIYETWIDGWVNETGSTVGYLEAPFAEQTVVNGGLQSMPLTYDNSAAPFYSEAEFDLGGANLNTSGADRLRLFVAGEAPSFFEATEGGILMNGIGSDIWETTDQFRYAYKSLTGNGSMVARVDSLDNGPSTWAKAGVMIRQGVGTGSQHSFMCMTGGDGNGASWQGRPDEGQASVNTDATSPVAPPYWVKIERAGNTLTGSISADGENWTQLGDPLTVAMQDPVLVGLALTSHNTASATSAEFSNVSFTGNVTGAWQIAEIGATQPAGNIPESLYVALEDSSGKIAVVTNPDNGATARSGWTEWVIPYNELGGINLNSVQTLYIGAGDRNNPSAGGGGTIFIDDIGYGRLAPEPAIENLLANGGFEDGVMAP